MLAEVTETYRTRGTLGTDADAFNRALADRLEEAQQHAVACNELHDAICRDAEDGAFRSGDYMVYFTLVPPVPGPSGTSSPLLGVVGGVPPDDGGGHAGGGDRDDEDVTDRANGGVVGAADLAVDRRY